MKGASAVRALCDAAAMEEPKGWRAYFELTQSWAARTDLVSVRSAEALAEILFLDAVQLIRARWSPRAASLVDVGAGAGAPTIPLVLSDSSLRAALVEPRRIRTAFLRTAIGALELVERVRVDEARIDPSRPAIDGAPFDVALSRATFAPEQWLEIGTHLAGEVWVLTAGSEPRTPDHLDLARRLDYQVPSSGAPRAILSYRAKVRGGANTGGQ